MNPPVPWKLPPDATNWEAGWESSRRFQIRHWASLSFEQKLAALEEMNDYAREATLRRHRRLTASTTNKPAR